MSLHSQQPSTSNLLPDILDNVLLLPPEIQDIIVCKSLKSRDKDMIQAFLEIAIKNHGIVLRGLKLHPQYPFCSLFHIHYPSRLPKAALYALWYLTRCYHICFLFDALVLYRYICLATEDPEVRDLYQMAIPGALETVTFLSWFKPLEQWREELRTHYGRYVVIKFKGPSRTPHPSGSNAQIVHWYSYNLSKSAKEPYNVDYVAFLEYMCHCNGVNISAIPNHVKFGIDPWNNTDTCCHNLSVCLFNYVANHFWSEGYQSSDTYYFADTDEDEDEGNED